METELDKRWRGGLAPFDGVTLTLNRFVPLVAVLPVLSAVVEILYDFRLEATLFRFMDWHEHDGIKTGAVPSNWQALRSLVSSEDSLWSACTHDTQVWTGFAPAQRDYYLRLLVPSISDSNSFSQNSNIRFANFDLTGETSLIGSAADAAREAGTLEASIEIIPAKAYFGRRYVGVGAPYQNAAAND